MPRLLVNFRERHMAESDFSSCLVGLIASAEESKRKNIDNLVEDIDGILYILASIGFIIGSVFFLPSMEEDRYPKVIILVNIYLLWHRYYYYGSQLVTL